MGVGATGVLVPACGVEEGGDASAAETTGTLARGADDAIVLPCFDAVARSRGEASDAAASSVAVVRISDPRGSCEALVVRPPSMRVGAGASTSIAADGATAAAT